MEFQIENKTEDVSFWIVFMYASTDRNERQRQWEYLKKRKLMWGTYLVDFNEIK